MKKFIVSLLLTFVCSIACAIGTHYFEYGKASGIHKFENPSSMLVILDTENNQITTDFDSYEIIESPNKWVWSRKHKEKYCVFQCTNKNFDKVFIKLIDFENNYYKIEIKDGLKSFYYYSKKVFK